MELFFTFVKIGLFTFGGGYAMISMIENNCVEKKAWITHDEMMDVTVIAESTPGLLLLTVLLLQDIKKQVFRSTCSYIGYSCAIFIVIFLISMFLDNFLTLTDI